MAKTKILRNVIKCNVCGDVIESKHVHELVMCSCDSCGVDGGTVYLRRLFKQEGCYQELSETVEVEE